MAAAANWLGRSIERVEDAALLTGRGRYIDDLGVPPATLHAAILRSPHAHANIRAIETTAAAAAPGVAAVIAGREVAAPTTLLMPALGAPTEESEESAPALRHKRKADFARRRGDGQLARAQIAISASRLSGRFIQPAEQSLK
jgi:CO/xanthine dehydrogenase Mo-binding subunit